MAPFILEQLRHTESVGSMSYRTFTDIFEENGPVPRPFHGGFGLINFQGFRKCRCGKTTFISFRSFPNESMNHKNSACDLTGQAGNIGWTEVFSSVLNLYPQMQKPFHCQISWFSNVAKWLR